MQLVPPTHPRDARASCRTSVELNANVFLRAVAKFLSVPTTSRVDSVLDSGAEGSGFKSQRRRCRVAVLDKLFTPIVPLFNKQQNW